MVGPPHRNGASECRAVLLLGANWAATMNVLVACEYSGRVRDAFRARGHNAMSCDLLPTEVDGPHYQGDVRDVLDAGWDLMVAHPECTYHTVAGARWFYEAPKQPTKGCLYGAERFAARDKAREFVRLLWGSGIPKIAIENPVGTLGDVIGLPTQIVQPYQFGHDISKQTCLWLKGLEPLVIPLETDWFPPRLVEVNGRTYKRWGNQSDKTGSSKTGSEKSFRDPNRWKERSRTYQGIADAMAEQWG